MAVLHRFYCNLVSVMTIFQEIRLEFDNEPLKKGQSKLQLSAAVASGRFLMECYDIPALAKY